MNLETTYLGLRLRHPVLPGASPLTDDLDMVKRLEDAGAPALVMRSLFEEQIRLEQGRTEQDLEADVSFAEASSFLPRPRDFRMGPVEYLEQIRKIRQATDLPVIASLNGTTRAGWTDYARLIEQAGAAALELNVYHLATDPHEGPEAAEGRVLDLLDAVKAAVRIPVAVKLSPFYSSLPNLALCLERRGADGLVLFNRFYQPDIDLATLEVRPTLQLSDSTELLLRLRWMAILAGRLRCDLACSGGVHTPEDALKAIFAGGTVVQVVSALLRHGPEHLRKLEHGVVDWLTRNEYESLAQGRGSMSLERCPDPSAFERANYMRVLQSLSWT